MTLYTLMKSFSLAPVYSLMFLGMILAPEGVEAIPPSTPETSAEVAEFIHVDVNADSRMEGASVNVIVKNRIAILSGTAHSLAQVERATARAIASQGVRAVVNQISITPVGTKELLKKSKSAFRSQKMIRANEISVSIQGDRAILEGKVGTLDERDLARGIISEVSGITAIDNRLEVTFEGIRKDSQIASQLAFMIKNDPLCEGLDLKASVSNGTVALSGKVGSKGEYDRLVRKSYVTGIMEVKAYDLHIDSSLAMEGMGDKDYSDPEALSALNQAYKMDDRVSSESIKANVVKGVITLKGTVGTRTASDAAEATARAIPGILHVLNELKVKGDDLVSQVAPTRFASMQR